MQVLAICSDRAAQAAAAGVIARLGGQTIVLGGDVHPPLGSVVGRGDMIDAALAALAQATDVLLVTSVGMAGPCAPMVLLFDRAGAGLNRSRPGMAWSAVIVGHGIAAHLAERAVRAFITANGGRYQDV